jgi:hypothetical protein
MLPLAQAAGFKEGDREQQEMEAGRGPPVESGCSARKSRSGYACARLARGNRQGKVTFLLT